MARRPRVGPRVRDVNTHLQDYFLRRGVLQQRYENATAKDIQDVLRQTITGVVSLCHNSGIFPTKKLKPADREPGFGLRDPHRYQRVQQLLSQIAVQIAHFVQQSVEQTKSDLASLAVVELRQMPMHVQQILDHHTRRGRRKLHEAADLVWITREDLQEADAEGECNWVTINGNHVCISGGHTHEGADAAGEAKVAAALHAAGLPPGIQLPPYDQALRTLFARGAFKLTATEDLGRYMQPGERYRVTIEPKLTDGILPLPIPESDQKLGIGKGQFYDSRIATAGADPTTGYARAFLKADSGYTTDFPLQPEAGYLYRGMSYEEYQSALKTGRIKSSGSYNLGQDQAGQTYFAVDPQTADSYASSFQPYSMTATFGYPAYIVKIKDPGADKTVRLPHIGANEVGVKGAIPMTDVLQVVELRPYSVKAGYIELNQSKYTDKPNLYSSGSGLGFSSRIAYKVLGKPLQEATEGDCNWVTINGNHVCITAGHTHEGGLRTTTEEGALNPKDLGKFEKALASYKVSRDAVTKEILSRITNPDGTPIAELLAQARQWYPDANAWARDLMGKANITLEQAVGVIAAISPQNPWERATQYGVSGNKPEPATVVSYYAQHANDSLTPQELAEGLSKMYDPKPGGANADHHLGPGLTSNLTSLEKAFSILRDGSRANLEAQLGTLKTASFYNNILAPGKTRSVTVDGHMAKAIAFAVSANGGPAMPKEGPGPKGDRVGSVMSAMDARVWGSPGHVLIADAVRKVADQLHESPDTIQAAYWLRVQNISPFKASKTATAVAEAQDVPSFLLLKLHPSMPWGDGMPLGEAELNRRTLGHGGGALQEAIDPITGEDVPDPLSSDPFAMTPDEAAAAAASDAADAADQADLLGLDAVPASFDTAATLADTIDPIPPSFRAVPNAQITELLGTPLGGSFYQTSFADLGASMVSGIRNLLLAGLANGSSVDTVSRDVQNLMGGARYKSDRIVRSEFGRVANQADLATFAANEDLLQGVQWLATLDADTCLQCGELDGQVFASSADAPVPVTDTHPNCRCKLIPVVKGADELGLPPGTRASFNGQVPDTLDYADWFDQQDAAFQQDVLGPTRYDLYANGDASLSDFASIDGIRPIRDVLASLGEAIQEAGGDDCIWREIDGHPVCITGGHGGHGKNEGRKPDVQVSELGGIKIDTPHLRLLASVSPETPDSVYIDFIQNPSAADVMGGASEPSLQQKARVPANRQELRSVIKALVATVRERWPRVQFLTADVINTRLAALMKRMGAETVDMGGHVTWARLPLAKLAMEALLAEAIDAFLEAGDGDSCFWVTINGNHVCIRPSHPHASEALGGSLPKAAKFLSDQGWTHVSATPPIHGRHQAIVYRDPLSADTITVFANGDWIHQASSGAAISQGHRLSGLKLHVFKQALLGPGMGVHEPVTQLEAGDDCTWVTINGNHVCIDGHNHATVEPVRLENSLGIERKDMPQIRGRDMAEFLTFASEKGVTITRGLATASSLRPAQVHYNPLQAAQMTPEILAKPITVSKDNYVLDGTNRWVRIVQDNPGQQIHVTRIDLPATEALALMHSFPKAGAKDVAQVGATKETAS